LNNSVINVLVFIGGATVGGVTAWLLTKDKYKKEAQEEIDEVRAVYEKKALVLENEIKKAHEYEKVKPVTQQETYETIVDDLGYKETESNNIHVIAPEEAGELDYDIVTLTYYADKVLTYDINDEVVEDVDSMVGFDSLNCFGEYEDDSVFVRNDATKTDYEILRDYRKYSEVVGEEAE
jgi:hypothetical protein